MVIIKVIPPDDDLESVLASILSERSNLNVRDADGLDDVFRVQDVGDFDVLAVLLDDGGELPLKQIELASAVRADAEGGGYGQHRHGRECSIGVGDRKAGLVEAAGEVEFGNTLDVEVGLGADAKRDGEGGGLGEGLCGVAFVEGLFDACEADCATAADVGVFGGPATVAIAENQTGLVRHETNGTEVTCLADRNQRRPQWLGFQIDRHRRVEMRIVGVAVGVETEPADFAQFFKALSTGTFLR